MPIQAPHQHAIQLSNSHCRFQHAHLQREDGNEQPQPCRLAGQHRAARHPLRTAHVGGPPVLQHKDGHVQRQQQAVPVPEMGGRRGEGGWVCRRGNASGATCAISCLRCGSCTFPSCPNATPACPARSYLQRRYAARAGGHSSSTGCSISGARATVVSSHRCSGRRISLGDMLATAHSSSTTMRHTVVSSCGEGGEGQGTASQEAS